MPLIHDQAIAAGDFAADPFHRPAAEAPVAPYALIPLARLPEADGNPVGVEIANDADLEALAPHFARLALISIRFPSFADGRGFSVARRLRCLGFTGRIRAAGHVIVDQYPFARACLIDEVEIDDASAARQPLGYWAAAAKRPGWYQRKVAAA